jgi:lysophospholipase L1-like esterase
MLLTYRNLRQKQAHPANLWWFFRVPPYVFDGKEQVEDQFAEWLYALRDIRHLSLASYTRITAPAQVAAAAATWATGGRDLATIRDWLNTRCGNFVHPTCPYVTAGPAIEQWAAINQQHDLPFSVRGKQRARCRFQVSSQSGIREGVVHNADYGVVRRFLGNGQPTFAQEFELSHDRDHALTLVVTDTAGRKAISDKLLLFCYKTSLLRCGDNLNFLNGVGLCWHPDRNEMMPLAQGYQGPPVESIRGYDTAAALTRQVMLRTWPIDGITTEELKLYPTHGAPGVLRKILDVVLPGNDVKICEMTMGPIVEPFDSLTRDTPARTSPPAIVEENRLFSRVHRSVYLQNRNNMCITWDYRRAREGAKDYRGGLVWHEGKITFKRDATLAGGVPIMLFYFTPSGSDPETANTLLVKDAEGGPVAFPIPTDTAAPKQGFVAPGGFVTAAPCDTYAVFYAGADTRFRYLLVADPKTGRVNQLQVGLGEPGQKVTAGTEIAYRFAMATLGGDRLDPAQYVSRLQDVGESFGLGGGDRGVRTTVTAGAVLGREVFLSVQAEGGEASFKVEPRPTIVDLPIRLQGIADNGCVAVYSTTRPFFRFVGVAEGSAWFQENVDTGAEIWAGNVFACDRPEVKLTLVCDGTAADRVPFLEVHNPTDGPVQTVLVSPAHTPRFGGLRLPVAVPAGASVVLSLPTAGQALSKGVPMKVQGESLVLAKTVPGKLCFDRVVSGSVVVRSTYLAGAEKNVVYREGVDYVVDDANGTIARTVASAMPDFSKNQLYDQKDFDHTKFPGFTNHPFFVWVDYTTDNGQAWARPNDQTPYLTGTRAKLEAGGPFRVVSYGDSIAAGGEASTPDLRFQARFGQQLQQRFPRAKVEVEDASISGYASAQGIDWWDKYIGKTTPDLVLVGWGMNDHNIGNTEPEQFRKNLVTLVGMIRGRKSAEVILFSAFPPNDDWHYGTHRMGLYADATRQAAAEARCAYVDVYATWAMVLKRKDQSSLLGNNINHPNDFGHWLYAQAFAALQF